MAIKFGVRAKVNQLRQEYAYLEEQIAIGGKLKIASGPTSVRLFIDLHDRMVGTLNYLNSIPKTATTRDAFAAEFEVTPSTVVPLFNNIISKVTAIRNWTNTNQDTAKEAYILGNTMSSRGSYTVAEMSSLTTLLDDLLTALAPVTE